MQAVIFLACAFVLGAQEKPDRPPWAQPGSTTPPPQLGETSEPKPPETPMGKTEPPLQSQGQNQGNSRGAIKVNVNLVTVLVSVLDDHNRPAPDLPIEAFQIFEEGVKQKIDVFEAETKLPLDLALMIDSSLSAHMEIGFERDAAARFIKQVVRPDDRMAVYSIDESVTPVAAFTNSVGTLQEAVRKIPAGSGTSIYDAIYLGSQALQKRGPERRRVIILVTDAGETTSRMDFDGARKAALRGEVLLYTIVVRPVKNENGRNTAGEHALQAITETTGGAMFYPDSAQDLAVIFDRIDSELRTQYRLAYYPNPKGPPNASRTIEVKVLAGYTARHRTNYWTGAQ